MDVIVDTNVLTSDPLMRTPRFEALFDYLRRTNSALVILSAVREELFAQHKRQLKRRYKDARNAWERLQDLLYTRSSFSSVVFDQEMKALDRLFSPESANIKLFHAQIDLTEVVKRGARRIRPANDEGEELRDVIIWLMGLKYAEELNGPVAFVSEDRGFWNGDHPHETIIGDIERSKVSITLYRDVEQLLRNINLHATKIDQQIAGTLINPEPFYLLILARAQDELEKNATKRWEILEIRQMEFIDGAIYDVSPNSRFAELIYKFAALCSEIAQEELTIQYPSPAHYPPIEEWAPERPRRYLRERVVFEGIARFSAHIVNSKVESAELDGVWIPFTVSDSHLSPPFRYPRLMTQPDDVQRGERQPARKK
jgi:PIN domain